jgi:SAM-dependent methyltransferase
MNDKWKSFYTREAGGYHRQRYASWYGRMFARSHQAAMHDLLHMHRSGGLILDLASGTGHNLEILSASGRLVIACDLTTAMLKESKNIRRERDNIRYSAGNALNLPFAAGTFDVVVSTRFLHLFAAPHQQQVLKEMVRVLKPNGLMLVDFYNCCHWRLLLPLIGIYRWALRKRPTEDTRNSIGDIHRLLEPLSMRIDQTVGIGSYLLALLRLLPQRQVVNIARIFRRPPGRCLSEQFLVASRKMP